MSSSHARGSDSRLTWLGVWRAKALLLGGVASLAACASTPAPSLVSVFPETGYPRQLIGVNGRTNLASVVWDPGLPTEVMISSGLAGTNYFQIPTNATPGAHQVALRNSGGDSAPATVTVIGCDPRSTIVETDPGDDGPRDPPPGGDVAIDGDDLVLEPGDQELGPGTARPRGEAIDGQDLEVAVGPEGETSSTQRLANPFGGLVNCGAYPGPRIEDIAIYRATDYGGEYEGELGNFLITVSAANLDTDARVSVARIAPTPIENRELSSCVRWGALPIDYLQRHAPGTFRYPIYHYVQMLCPLEHNRYGSEIAVTVTNIDGKSDTRRYTLPASLEALDSDNDGVSDALENGGATGVDLPGMGADPLRKTIFVEIDWTAAGQPMAGLWTAVEAAFDAAPVLNPDGSAGIDIIMDYGQGGLFTEGGQTLAAHTTMDFGANAMQGYTDFYTYKAANFPAARDNIFRYAVFGRARPSNSSGRGEIWGNDFMVTFATFSNWNQIDAQVGTFIHELGHNLALRHGGLFEPDDEQMNDTDKPNQISTMNYRYQFSGVSTDCNFTAESPTVFTFAQGSMADINETALDERRGICDGADLDLDGNGAVATSVQQGNANVGEDPADSDDVHREFDEWGNIRLSFTTAPDAND